MNHENEVGQSVATSPYYTYIKPRRGWSAPNLRALWRYRDLLYEMTKRDIKVRYRQTALGVIWVIMQPLAQALIYAGLFGFIAKLPSDGEVPYFLFICVNLMGWGFFSSSVTRGATSFISQSNLIKKVYFPRILVPVSTMLGSLLDLLIVFGVVIVMLLVYGVPIKTSILTLPIWILILILLAGGVSFWLSALAVYYRDFRNATGLIFQLWMYITPVVYSEKVIPSSLQVLFNLNPVTAPIMGIRWALLGTTPPNLIGLVISVLSGLLLFVSGAMFLRRVERSLADVI